MEDRTTHTEALREYIRLKHDNSARDFANTIIGDGRGLSAAERKKRGRVELSTKAFYQKILALTKKDRADIPPRTMTELKEDFGFDFMEVVMGEFSDDGSVPMDRFDGLLEDMDSLKGAVAAIQKSRAKELDVLQKSRERFYDQMQGHTATLEEINRTMKAILAHMTERDKA